MDRRILPQSNTSPQLGGDKSKSFLQILNGYIEPFLKRAQSPVCSDSNANRIQKPIERCSTELDGFVFVEQIELSHFSNSQISREEKNKGHTFERTHLNKPTWCDQCGDFIWGAYKDCLKCHNCDYICHYKCRCDITVECQHNGGHHSFGEDQKGKIHGSLEEENNDLFSASPCKDSLTSDDIYSQIQTFNNNQHGLSMSMEDKQRFSGSIRIYLNLFRPVKMTLENHLKVGKKSSDSEESESETDSTTKTISFHLPRNTSQVIRINSETKTRDVIKKFLKKYRIIDNPCKFALYESVYQGEGHASIRRLSDDEYPLIICLNWSIDGLNKRSFILRENDTNDIQWDAFSIPELESFLKILQREEEEYRMQIKNKYAQTRSILQHRIAKIERKRFGDDKRTPIFV